MHLPEQHLEASAIDTLMQRDWAGDMPSAATSPQRANLQDAVHLDFWVREPDAVVALIARPEGRERDDYSRCALRIGILALQQAQGRIDADIVRGEGERLMVNMEARLQEHQRTVDSVVAGTLKSYFDPKDGRFNERIERLVSQDGELETLLRNQIERSARSLDQALLHQVGPESALAKLLTPDDSNRLLTAIRSSVGSLVNTQQDQILGEFSLDNPVGALARLVTELQQTNGAFADNLKIAVQNVAQEFSLDKDDSALSRLVKKVEQTQEKINAQFSLDTEESALSRMKRDLLDVVERHQQQTIEFQATVVTALGAMKARREESLASTRHGNDFEQAAFEFIDRHCQKLGDVAEHTGSRTGEIRHDKKGDCVIALGPEAEAAGARIVCEMKEDAGYDLRRTLNDIEAARANRKADVGLFIHSAKTAPANLQPLARYKNDIVVVWDAEDETSDTFLAAALMICRALAVRQKTSKSELAADFAALEKAIREVERQAGFLDEIRTSSGTIKNGAEKILDRVERMRTALAKQVEILDVQAGLLKDATGTEGP